MAQKIIVEMVDDLDGTAGGDVTTVAFGLDGHTYEIDLSEVNARKLRDSLAEFVTAARRQRGGRSGRGRTTAAPPARATATRERSHTIREWAREAGHEVSDRGRIPASVLEAYEAAQRGASPSRSTEPASSAQATTSQKSAKKPSRRRTKSANSTQPAFSG